MKIFAASFFLLTCTLNTRGDALLVEAETALREGLPQIGIQKLKLYLGRSLEADEIRRVTLEIAQASLSLNSPEVARDWLARLTSGEDARFLLVQSHLLQQNWQKVVQLLEILPEKQSAYYARCIFARAEAFRGLGQNDRADADYRIIENNAQLGNAARLRRADLALQTRPASAMSVRLSNTDDLNALQAATLLTAQSEILSGASKKAEAHFRSLLENPAQLTSTSYVAMYLGLTEALAGQNRLDEAGDLLESFIDERPRHEQLDDVFARLNGIYQKEKNPSQSQLRRWSKDEANPERQALSIYYQSQFELRDKGSDAALAILSGWLEKFPAHPLRASVLLRYGEQLIAENKFVEGIRRLNEGLQLTSTQEITGNLHLALAKALFGSRQFAEAAGQYRKAALILTQASQILLYNVALCWLRDSNLQQFLTVYQELSALFPANLLQQDLLFEEGFLQARSNESTAAGHTLRSFLQDYPGHPRVPAAHLALAELSMQTSPADTERQILLAAQAAPSREIEERAAYLKFFQNIDNEKSELNKQITQCEAFLKEYPKSSFEAEVRFKLGEAWFGEKNYTAAGTQFELISRNFPDSSLSEQARFLAGQSAIRTMNPNAVDGAISLFEQVVRMKGPLQAYARFEQASVKRNNGAYEEALVLYNDLLTQTPPADLLASTLAAKAETLYLQGGGDPGKITASVETFNQLAILPGVSRYWRNLALYKKGKGLEWLGRKDEMLVAYYDALTLPNDSSEVPEYYWFYRAGFGAAASLEADGQWDAAIAIYRKLSAAKGPRSAEAEERTKRLRLEHFIWEK